MRKIFEYIKYFFNKHWYPYWDNQDIRQEIRHNRIIYLAGHYLWHIIYWILVIAGTTYLASLKKKYHFFGCVHQEFYEIGWLVFLTFWFLIYLKIIWPLPWGV